MAMAMAMAKIAMNTTRQKVRRSRVGSFTVVSLRVFDQSI
jgi:hypothetical protein